MLSSDVIPALNLGVKLFVNTSELLGDSGSLDNREVYKLLQDVAFFLAAGPGVDRFEAYIALQDSISDVYAKFDSR